MPNERIFASHCLRQGDLKQRYLKRPAPSKVCLVRQGSVSANAAVLTEVDGAGALFVQNIIAMQRLEGWGTTMLRGNRDSRAERQLSAHNVLGEPLEFCSMRPMTGFHRDGCCNTGPEDVGSHTVCAVMTAAFLDFSKSRGNDLSTPVPELGFPGLKPGDRWCLCAPRWQEAFEANQAPRVVLRATHEAALSYCSLADLKRLAVDLA